MVNNSEVLNTLDLIRAGVDSKGNRANYRFVDNSVTLKCSDYTYIEFVNSHFANYFTISEASVYYEPDFTVYVCSQSPIADRLIDIISMRPRYSSHEETQSVTIDENNDMFIEANVEDKTTATDIYFIDRKKKIVTMLMRNSHFSKHYVPLRTVRDLMKLLLLEQGMLPFTGHA